MIEINLNNVPHDNFSTKECDIMNNYTEQRRTGHTMQNSDIPIDRPYLRKLAKDAQRFIEKHYKKEYYKQLSEATEIHHLQFFDEDSNEFTKLRIAPNKPEDSELHRKVVGQLLVAYMLLLDDFDSNYCEPLFDLFVVGKKLNEVAQILKWPIDGQEVRGVHQFNLARTRDVEYVTEIGQHGDQIVELKLPIS